MKKKTSRKSLFKKKKKQRKVISSSTLGFTAFADVHHARRENGTKKSSFDWSINAQPLIFSGPQRGGELDSQGMRRAMTTRKKVKKGVSKKVVRPKELLATIEVIEEESSVALSSLFEGSDVMDELIGKRADKYWYGDLESVELLSSCTYSSVFAPSSKIEAGLLEDELGVIDLTRLSDDSTESPCCADIEDLRYLKIDSGKQSNLEGLIGTLIEDQKKMISLMQRILQRFTTDLKNKHYHGEKYVEVFNALMDKYDEGLLIDYTDILTLLIDTYHFNLSHQEIHTVANRILQSITRPGATPYDRINVSLMEILMLNYDHPEEFLHPLFREHANNPIVLEVLRTVTIATLQDDVKAMLVLCASLLDIPEIYENGVLHEFAAIILSKPIDLPQALMDLSIHDTHPLCMYLYDISNANNRNRSLPDEWDIHVRLLDYTKESKYRTEDVKYTDLRTHFNQICCKIQDDGFVNWVNDYYTIDTVKHINIGTLFNRICHKIQSSYYGKLQGIADLYWLIRRHNLSTTQVQFFLEVSHPLSEHTLSSLLYILFPKLDELSLPFTPSPSPLTTQSSQ